MTVSLPARTCLFVGLLALYLLPPLFFHYLPVSDGPAHLYNAYVIKQRLLGSDNSAAFFSLNPAPVPNWTDHLFLALATTILTPDASERALQFLIVLAFPLAFLYFLRSVSRDTKGLEFLVFPFVYGIHFHWGFYNFCLSLVFYLLAIGAWIRWRECFSPVRALKLSLLLLLTYFSSLVGFIQCLFTFGCLILIDAALTRMWPRVTELMWTAIAGLPAVLVYIWFVARQVNRGTLPTEFPPPLWAAASLFRFDILRTFTPAEKPLAAGFALLFWLFVAFECHRRWKTGRAREGIGFLLLAAALVPIVFLAPTTASGGTMLTPRQVYFVVFALALWLASGAIPVLFQRIFVGASIIVAVSLLAFHWPIYAQYDTGMRRLLSGLEHADLSGRTTVVAWTLGNPFPQNLDPRSRRVDLSGALGGYLAIAHGLVYLNDYEAQTTHFPLIYRYSLAGSAKLRYASAPNRSVDAVLLWGTDDQAEKDAAARQILEAPFDRSDYPGLPEHPTLYLPRALRN